MFAKNQKIILKKEDESSLGINVFQNDVIKILRMSPVYRKEEEIQRLVDYLVFFEVFKEIKNIDHLRTISRSATYLYVEQGNFVFQQGDPPDYFYILVRGEVAGTVKKVEGPQTKFLDEVDVIFKLSHGSGFGEKALIENIARTASLIATKASHLMLITREDYMQTVRMHHLLNAEKNIVLLDEIKLFANFDEKKKSKFTSFCYEHTYPSNSVLLAQDAPVTKLIFLKTGTIAMYRHISLANVSERIKQKYSKEIAAAVFPIKFKVGTLGNSDQIGLNEFILKEKSKFDYEVQIPSRGIEISTSDFVKQDNFLEFLTYDQSKLAFPTDDIFIQEYFEQRKWKAFQKQYSEKIMCEMQIAKLDRLRASEKHIENAQCIQTQTSEKVKIRLRKINVGIKNYMEEVKNNLPMIANTKNHVALYEIINAKGKNKKKLF